MKKYPLLYVFSAIIIGLSVIDVVTPDKEFSPLENRKLSQSPKFTVKSFFKGEFTSKYEKYVNDQFIGRDGWIDIKSRSEYALGKIENNGIVYGEDKFMFEKVDSIDGERYKQNINSLKLFTEKNKDKVSIIISPNSSGIYEDKLPMGNLLLNQDEYINEIYNELPYSNNINLLDLFNNEKDKYIYYKTDHHWTTLGAYLAYGEFIKSIGSEPVELGTLSSNNVTDFYGTYYNKAKLFNAEADTLEYYDFDNLEVTIGENTHDSIYDFSKIQEADKYSMFLWGNNPLTVVKNKTLNNGKKIIVIKDSYANAFIPFLTENYEEVHVLDLRHFNIKLSDYLEENNFDDILVLYNFNTFISDVNVVKIKY